MAGREGTEAEEIAERALGGVTFSVEKFVESFPVLVQAAGGAKHLRELVLRMATRGRLTEQLPSDGEVDPLVAEIDRRRARLVKDKKASATDDQGPISIDEVPFPIPSTWRWVRFGVATICRDGQRIPVSKEDRATRQGAYPYYGASGIIDTIDDFIFDEPLLLVGEDGANLVNRSTPIAFIATGKYWVNNHAHVLDGANLDYLRYLSVFINATDLVPYVTGTAQPKMNQAKMISIPVPLPPLAEQKRIVARVDQLMALIDQLEAKQNRKRDLGARFTKASLEALTTAESPQDLTTAWTRIHQTWPTLLDHPAKVGEVRTTILLELAVRGRLVPGRAGDDSVDEQLHRIRQAQTRLGSKRNEEPIPAEALPYEIPTHWRWVRWGDLVLGTSAGWSPQCEAFPRGEGQWGVLKVSAVSWDVFQADENKALPKNIAPREEAMVRIGDFLMSRANTAELVGRSVVVTSQPVRLLMSDKIVRCEFSKEVDQQYINLFNRTSAARTHYIANASGTSDSMKNISRHVILSMPVPLPPLAEQKRIVAKVEHLMKLCDALEAALRRSEDRAAKLACAVVQEMVA